MHSGMLTLGLNANPDGWRHFITRKQDPSFQKLATLCYERDKFTCQYCGILMPKGQEVVNIDSCYTNNELTNLVTACGFCAQCGFLEAIGFEKYGGGTLIYLPEISQAHLNGCCYAFFKSIHDMDQQEVVAQKAYRSLSLRAQLVETHLGNGMSDPAVFGQLMIESAQAIEPNTFLANLRLLPTRSAFKVATQTA